MEPSVINSLLNDITICTITHTTLNTAALVSSNLQGRIITAMIDSGASVSCISAKFLASLAQHVRHTLQPTPDFEAINALGEEMRCLGKVKLAVTFPN